MIAHCQNSKLAHLYCRTFDGIATALQPVLLFVLRLHWGWDLFMSGRGKLLNHDRTVQFFSSINLPSPDLMAWSIGAVEATCGMLLLVGLFSRPVSLIIAGTMIGAYLSVEEDRAAFFNLFTNPDKFTEAAPFMFLLTALIVLAFGPGKISLDALLCRLACSKNVIPEHDPKEKD